MACEFCGVDTHEVTSILMGNPYTVELRCDRDPEYVAYLASQSDEAKARESAIIRKANRESVAGKIFAGGFDTLPLSETLVNSGKRYAAEPKGWLLFVGPSGTAKTGLAAAIGIEYGERHGFRNVKMISTAELMRSLRAVFNDEGSDPLPALKEIGLLVLDDLGAQSPTPFALESLWLLLDHRLSWDKPTIVTTNDPLRDIGRRPGWERIADRLSVARIVTVTGKSKRRAA